MLKVFIFLSLFIATMSRSVFSFQDNQYKEKNLYGKSYSYYIVSRRHLQSTEDKNDNRYLDATGGDNNRHLQYTEDKNDNGYLDATGGDNNRHLQYTEDKNDNEYLDATGGDNNRHLQYTEDKNDNRYLDATGGDYYETTSIVDTTTSIVDTTTSTLSTNRKDQIISGSSGLFISTFTSLVIILLTFYLF
jgi:hypothetical protein